TSEATALLGNVLNGLDAAYPENHLFDQLSDQGRAFAQATSQECSPAVVLAHPLVISSTLFADGRPLSEHLGDAQWRQPLADQLLGMARPSAPVLVVQSIADEIVPASSTEAVVRRWCALGAKVAYQPSVVPGHLTAAVATELTAIPWLNDRVQGK